jgi:protocatechuate 3,4-dioxygenase beta subunit
MTIAGMLLIALFAQQRTGSIQGVVVKAGSSEPVLKAVIELSGNGSQPIATSTGADGKFEFRNVAPGRYRLAASRAGFLDSAYGQRGPNGTGSALVIENGQSLKDIRLTLIQTGAISGRVFDNTGEPLANVSVHALKYSYGEGRPKLTDVKTAETNDRGEYRLFWLPPGMYTVSATPQTGVAGQRGMTVLRLNSLVIHADGSAADKLGEAYAPVYYPGTTDPQGAAPVELRPGADVGGVDFTLERVTTRKVRGVVLDNQGQPVNSANVVLIPRGASISPAARGFVEANGSFEIAGVLPGSYILVGSSRTVGGRGRGENEVHTLAGRTSVDVRGFDVDRVSVIMTPPVDINGSLVLEGAQGLPEDAHPVGILKSDLAGGSDVFIPAAGPQRQEFAATSRFIESVVEGDYRVEVDNLPRNTYVKSIRFGGADVLNDGLRVDTRSTDRLDIVLSANAATIDGVVTSKDRQPVANSVVALVPDLAHRTRDDLYRSAATDESGRFRLQNIAPGDYFLFAWEDIEPGIWRDPEFVRRNAALGKAVHINEAARENIEITAIPFGF